MPDRKCVKTTSQRSKSIRLAQVETQLREERTVNSVGPLVKAFDPIVLVVGILLLRLRHTY